MNIPWLLEYNYLIFDELDSTNTEALRIAQSTATGNFVILAKNQFGGRGRKGKSWASLAGNLHLSILQQCLVPKHRYTELPFLVGLSLYEVIYEISNKDVKTNLKLKWPNDVMIGDKKLAGILLESINFKGQNYIIIGLGVNIMDYPENIDQPSTSLQNEGVIISGQDHFLNLFMIRFQENYNRWLRSSDFDYLRKEWLQIAYKLGQKITIKDRDIEILGLFKSIDKRGGLIVEQEDGTCLELSAGEIF